MCNDQTRDMEKVLQEEFVYFRKRVRQAFWKAAQKYFTEEFEGIMESVDFQIKLYEEEDWNTIVLGESPKEGELFKTKEQEERIAFSHSSVNIKKSSMSYKCAMTVIYRKDTHQDNIVLVKPVIGTILEIMQSRFTNLAAIIGEIYGDQSEWKNFGDKVSETDFMEYYKKQLRELYNLPEWDKLEKVCFENYEKREIAGTLCMIDPKLYTGKGIIRFEKSISKDDAWEGSCMRKMIEASGGNDSCLLVNRQNMELVGMAI